MSSRYNLKTCSVICVIAALAIGNTAAPSAVLTFEDLGGDLRTDLARDRYCSLGDANSRSGKESFEYKGIVWERGWYIAGDLFIASAHDASDWFSENGSAPFARPRSGHYAAFTWAGRSGLGFSSPTQYLKGVWFARPTMKNNPGGATKITVSACSNATVLASVSLGLTNTAPVFMDTSIFLRYPGINRYAVDRVEGPGLGNDRGFFIADDFHFEPFPGKTGE